MVNPDFGRRPNEAGSALLVCSRRFAEMGAELGNFTEQMDPLEFLASWKLSSM